MSHTTDERERLRAAWADLVAARRRLAADWEATDRYHAERDAALDARAAELDARTRAAERLAREVAELREEAAALDARTRAAHEALADLERRRAERDAAALAPRPAPAAELPPELAVALDRAADRDLSAWAADLDAREARLSADRAELAAVAARWAAERAEFADRKRVLAEQLGQLAEARERWQAAERATVDELEELARAVRSREQEQDARARHLARADARRREDAYELWQLRLRLEAWQARIAADELRWHGARERLEAERAERAEPPPAVPGEALPLARPVPDPTPAEVEGLRAELERVSAVLLEAEPPEPPDSALPWGAEGADEPVPLALFVPEGDDDRAESGAEVAGRARAAA